MQHQSAEIRLKINISLGGEEHPPGLQANVPSYGLVWMHATRFSCYCYSVLPLPSLDPSLWPSGSGQTTSVVVVVWSRRLGLDP